DPVLVPFADLLLDRLVRLHPEEVPRLLGVLAVLVYVHLEAVHQPDVAGAAGEQLRLPAFRPDLVLAGGVAEHPAVAGLGRPAPLDLQHVVAVLLLRDDVAERLALAVDRLVLDGPDVLGLRLALVARVEEGLPAGEVLAVEERDRLALLLLR